MSVITIVIPTYWTWGLDQANRPVEAIFDHPTPVDGQSTLPRLLDSFVRLSEPSFRVLVLTGVVHPDLAYAAENRVEALIAPFREHFLLDQFGPGKLKLVRKRLNMLGFDPSLVNLSNYAGIRNCQLLVPHVWGSQIVVALDDDEEVPPNYLQTVRVAMRHRSDDEPVLGLAGFYEDVNGEVLLPESPDKGNIFLNKARIMNDGARALLTSPGRLVLSAIAFGGNMVFHRDLFSQVSFDPGVTRGEDLDYVLNARLAGFQFWLDKDLRITHLPPHHYDTSPYVKMAEDVRRFIYEREKLRLAAARGFAVPTEVELYPYPGRFLADDVPAQARLALAAIATPDLIQTHGSPEEIVTQAQTQARRVAPHYFTFAQIWPQLMNALQEDDFLREQLSTYRVGSEGGDP